MTTHVGTLDPLHISKAQWERELREALRHAAFSRLTTRRPKYEGISSPIDWDLIRKTIQQQPHKLRPITEAVLVGSLRPHETLW